LGIADVREMERGVDVPRIACQHLLEGLGRPVVLLERVIALRQSHLHRGNARLGHLACGQHRLHRGEHLGFVLRLGRGLQAKRGDGIMIVGGARRGLRRRQFRGNGCDVVRLDRRFQFPDRLIGLSGQAKLHFRLLRIRRLGPLPDCRLPVHLRAGGGRKQCAKAARKHENGH
jgi:hypothetical protein